ncbi:MAG: sensor domain-containing diguanylate cyclase [Candidatus Latescibacterota bacterium]|jgi:diguanylate cyclase (GGDEF)-like protein|nr:MAG: sensor domain-containing diguanylate cyclase [Candidatus Latescibacterota bacterium]
MVRTLDERDLLFKTFTEVASLISSGKDNRIIFQKILDNALTILPSRKVYLILLDNHRIVKYTGQTQERGKKVTVEDLPESAGIVNWLQREYEESKTADNVFSLDLSILANEFLRDEDASSTVISAPLMAKNALFGIILAMNDPLRRRFTEEDIHLLTVMANHAAIAFENYLLYKKLEMESITDGLTGIYNYRFLIRSIHLEIKRASRFGYPFSYLMMDVDNLKEYNDRYGHLSGSRALKDIAGVVTRSCREIDLVAKYGGDEFALLLPQTTLDGALRLGERILEAVREFKFDERREGLLTCSIGAAVYPDDARTVETLIERADAALYAAKSKGKNGILSYGALRGEAPS